MFWLLFALLFFGGALCAQDTNGSGLETLSRAERVHVLRQRNWEVQAAPLEGKLRIDGKLDEPAWQKAAPVSDFYQRERNEGLPATERTEVRVLYDTNNLYIGFRCLDKEPERAKARAMFRDESAGADDLASIMLDAYNDHRSAIQLVTNANGLMEDLFQTGETKDTRNHNWDAVWNARGSRNDQGWEVEIVVPFKSLRFQPPANGDEAVFGIGFKRNIPRKNEEVYWPFVSNDSSWYRPSELGHLHGLRKIEPGRSIEARPYGLTGTKYNPESGSTEGRADAGLDLKWGVTPGLTADFTVNTDFAQEEVDVQQINFTRFSLFFPEKRQFFLEGERMFQFGVPQEAELVFTRRIGLSDSGEIIPILGGARLSGREGPYSIGAMNIQTRSSDGYPSENFTVLRVRRDILNRSSVGALFTNRQGGDRYNRVYGADFNLLFKQVWTLEGFLSKVDEPGSVKGTQGGYLHFGYDTDRWGLNYHYADVGENFNPGIGFVRRPDARTNIGEIRYSPRPGWSSVRQFELGSSFEYITDQSNVLETRTRGGHFTTHFESGDAVTFTFENHLEAITEPFDLTPDIAIPPGTYRFNTLESRLDTFERRHARLSLAYGTGGFWGGNRDYINVVPQYRVNRHLDLSGNYAVNWIDLPQGSFVTHLVSSRFQVVFRNDMAINTLFQYNSESRLFSSYVRFRWIFRPGSDFFVVYNETDEPGGLFNAVNRTLTVKINYLLAY